MFTLSINVKNWQELDSIVASLRHSAPQHVVEQVEEAAGLGAAKAMSEATTAIRHTEVIDTAIAEPAKKSTRTKKAAPPADTTTGGQAPVVDAAAQAPTIDAARAALSTVVTGKGMDAGFALLKQFNANRVTELQAADYDAFITACQAA